MFHTPRFQKSDNVLQSTVSWHEDLGKFPNCLNSIPDENLGLKKENEQKFFLQLCMDKKLYYWMKIATLIGNFQFSSILHSESIFKWL